MDERAVAPALVEPVGELVEVAGQVLGAHAVGGAREPALEVREDGMAPREEPGSESPARPDDEALVAQAGARQRPVAVEAVGEDRDSMGIRRGAERA